MKEFTQSNIEHWLQEFVETMPLNCANAEKFNIMCKAMKNLGFIHREFTEDDARAWVAAMDPPARWTMDQTTALLVQHGYNHRPCEFWAVMNALQSDYGKTAVRYNVDRPEFWAAMAHDFICDADAEDDKVGRYWRDIVRHDY